MSAGLFEVRPDALVAGAEALAADATDVSMHGTAAAGAAGRAGDAAAAGPLVGALARFSTQVGERSSVMSEAVDAAGATLRGNAFVYLSGDSSAATLLGGG